MMKFEGFPHVILSQQFSRNWLEWELFPLIVNMQTIFENRGCDMLQGKRMVSFFYQPSTRTRMSFEMAMDYLGGKVVFSTENAREFSSGAKGESLKDTICVINRYRPDVIVLRYDQEIGSQLAKNFSVVPIINAGDRHPGQHPTQALLDWVTIKKIRGEVDGLHIAMVGDLKEGRTVRSLCYLLGKFNDVQISFVSPKELQMRNDVKDYLARHRVAIYEVDDIRKVASSVDVIYQTRVQKECGSAPISGPSFVVDIRIVNMLKSGAIIMHPLPRVDEILEEVDTCKSSVYLTHQIDSGLFTRMALLKMILAPEL